MKQRPKIRDQKLGAVGVPKPNSKIVFGWPQKPANVAWNLFYIPDGPALSILHCELIPIANAAKFGVPPLAPSLQPLDRLFRRQSKGTIKTPPLPPATSRTLCVT